jgi:tetratricopeptide (TPR) repeat protein
MSEAKFRAVYRAGGTPADFRAIYGVPLGVLEKEWHDEVETAPLSDQDRGVARERFRRGGIFQRPCPHAVARRTALAGRLVAAGEPDEAVAVLRQICRDDPGEPSHRLALAATLERAGKPEAALAGYEALGHDDRLSGPLRARALMAAADLAARGGDLARASRLVDEALVHPTDEATRRNLGLRKLAFDPGPGGVAALRAYLLARGPDNRDPDPALLVLKAVELAQARPDSGLGHYLVGRLLEQRGALADAARALARAQALGLPDELVARENDRLLAVASFLAGDRALTRAAAARLAAPSQPLAVQAEGQDWLERCELAEKGVLLPPGSSSADK